MRADRLLAILLLLQHRGRMSAAALAGELEVSQRTVLRDVEALSSAGVPVYAERGRHGGFALLPGYSTDLTGLTHDEALALLVVGSRGDAAEPGPDLASAMRKVVAALPAPQRATATRDAGRVLVRREGWLRQRDPEPDEGPEGVLPTVRRAVFAGHRLRLRYAARGEDARWRTVDPIGLVSAAGRWYLLANRDGEERSYRLSRVREAAELDEPARRTDDVDLDRAWRERRDRWRASWPGTAATVRVRAARRADLLRTARAVLAEAPDEASGGAELVLDVEFSDPAHAVGTVWAPRPDHHPAQTRHMDAYGCPPRRRTSDMCPHGGGWDAGAGAWAGSDRSPAVPSSADGVDAGRAAARRRARPRAGGRARVPARRP